MNMYNKVLPIVLLLPAFSTMLPIYKTFAVLTLFNQPPEHVLYFPDSVPLSILFFLLGKLILRPPFFQILGILKGRSSLCSFFSLKFLQP